MNFTKHNAILIFKVYRDIIYLCYEPIHTVKEIIIKENCSHIISILIIGTDYRLYY